MSEEINSTKPKLEVISKQLDNNPGSIFDDLASLRKVSKLTVHRKAVLVNVTVDRPPNNVYFRCHRELILDDTTVVRDTGTNKATYFVSPQMRAHPKLAPHLRKVTLVLTSTWPSGNFLIWPVPILGERSLAAWKSARTAYELARDKWVLMVWSEEKNDYQVELAEPEGIKHEPVWPEKDFEELLKLGFDGKIIDNEEHPYVRRLRGLLD
jgi:hypothetical protein